ncbi:hypothetical protein F511_14916 [Dorcoceras hygrometricum]|uniref:Uncharacterized protein n=1 Tax=Dorcoceras hygrometricum TaxID=472368 RepID=A0A2Z7C1E6_9LAMI|nr:hypothetical protein F511_14916 [Dorcoceras hygrometricum]
MELSLCPLLLHAFCHLVSATAEPCLPAAGLVIAAAATCWLPFRDVPAGYYHRKIHRLNLSAKEKRCRIHLSKRHRLTTANIKFQRLLLLLSSTTDQTSHFRMRPVLFLPKRPNEQDSLLHRIQLGGGPQPLWLRNYNSGPAHRIMVKRLATSPHDPLGITDSACKNQSVVVSVQYGPFNSYIPIRSTTIGKSRVARDPIAMHTSWRSNSDIASVTSIGYPRMSASGESSTTKHRLLHASGSHPIPTPYDPKLFVILLAQQLNHLPTAGLCFPAAGLVIPAAVHSRINVLCSTSDSADVKVADPPVVSTADLDFLLLQLVHLSLTLQLVDVIFFLSFDQHLLSTSDQLLLLSSTTDQTSHFRMRPVLFPPKRSNEQDSLLRTTCWFLLRDVHAGYYHRKIHRLNLSAKAKRCRIHLSKRHRLTTANIKFQRLLTAESFSSVHSRITVLCSTADSADVKVADPPVVSTADPDFLLLQLLLLLSSTTDQTSHFRMRPVLFPPKRPNEQDSLLRNRIHLTAAQLLMTSRLLKSSISLDDVTTAEYFSFASIQTFLLHNC